MYFVLNDNAAGATRISEAGMRAFIQQFLPVGVICSSFTLDGECGGIAVLSAKSEREGAISYAADRMGIAVKFVYARVPEPDVEIAEKLKTSLCSNWAWAVVFAFAALIWFVGLSGIFWLSFWGSLGWFAAKAIKLRRSVFERDKIT